MQEGLYQRITWAREVLGIPQEATWEEIEARFKELVKQWHPDRCREAPPVCQERTREILEAHQVLKDYCARYRFSFAREEVEKYLSPEEWWFKRFGTDPTWSGMEAPEPGEGKNVRRSKG